MAGYLESTLLSIVHRYVWYLNEIEISTVALGV